MTKGWCSKASYACNGSDSVCQLNPKAGKQLEFVFFGSSARRGALMHNCSCCFYRVLDVVAHSQV